MPSNALRRRPGAVAVTALLAAAAAACGDAEPRSPSPEGSAQGGSERSETVTSDSPPPQPNGTSFTADLEPPPCPPALADCVTAAGTILYVERVDPDGDGDAHFVLLSRAGITAPGISVIDVRPDLRPEPLPGPGDALAAAGPVFEGSFGQRQIQAEAIELARVP